MVAHVIVEGPVLFFGGPYSNLQATRALLAEAEKRGIPAERIVCTGDLVAYCADACATVALVREAGLKVVMGNCEEALAGGSGDCGCGFAPGSSCDRLSTAWFAHADRQLGSEDRAWMAGLPRRLDVTFAGTALTLAAVHGGLNEINRFFFASTPDRVKALDIAGTGVDGVVGGHCGLPFTQSVDGRLWHNPGVIGMPANDGTPRVWFSVIGPGPDPGSFAVEHAALAYDYEAASASMRASGLPQDYAQALGSGLWPSCDLLPNAELQATGVPLRPGLVVHRPGQATPAWPARTGLARINGSKFRDPAVTANGERRAKVGLERLQTLWINTGTLCNLACESCYIESNPRNDRLAYLTAPEVSEYLDEIERERFGTELIGFTGGEPFMNRDLPTMLEEVLSRGFRALVLTNGMKPMRRNQHQLVGLRCRYGERLTIRVSIDHYTKALHELERGPGSWQPTIDGLVWLSRNGLRLNVAGRLYSGEAEGIVRAGYARLFAECGITLDANDPLALVLFPEMDETLDVPEITDACWSILGKNPAEVMCSSSRMVVKRKGADAPAVLACTLLAYNPAFELGRTLQEASRSVHLNHPHCARFCVLGGATCSTGGITSSL